MMRQNPQNRLAPGSKTAPTPAMLDALAALAEGEMICFRVGYARTFKGPFFPFGTIEGLWKRDLVDLTCRHTAKTRIAINRHGRAALAAASAEGAAA